jgi:hypothetical protein
MKKTENLLMWKLRGSEHARLILVSKLLGAFLNLNTGRFQD